MSNNLKIISKGNKSIVPIVDINNIIMDDNTRNKLSKLDNLNNIFRQAVTGIPINASSVDATYESINGNILLDSREYVWSMLPNMIRSTTAQSSTGDIYPINVASMNNIDYLLDNVWVTKSSTGNISVNKNHKTVGQDITSLLNVGGTGVSGYAIPSIFNGTTWVNSSIPLEIERQVLTGTPTSALFAYGTHAKADGLFGSFNSHCGIINTDNYLRYLSVSIDSRVDAIGFGAVDSTIVTCGRTSSLRNNMLDTNKFNGEMWSIVSPPSIPRIIGGGAGKTNNGLIYGPDPHNPTQLQPSELYNGEFWRTTGDVNVSREDATSSGLSSMTYLGGIRPSGTLLTYLSAEHATRHDNNIKTVKTKNGVLYTVLDGPITGKVMIESSVPLPCVINKPKPTSVSSINYVIDDIDHTVAKDIFTLSASTPSANYDIPIGEYRLPKLDIPAPKNIKTSVNVHYPKNTSSPIIIESDIAGVKKTFNILVAEKDGVWRITNDSIKAGETRLQLFEEMPFYLGTNDGKMYHHSGKSYNPTNIIPVAGLPIIYGNAVSGVYNDILSFGGKSATNVLNTKTTRFSFGSSEFISTANFNNPRSYLSGIGVADATLAVGGINGSTILNTTDFYNGTTWSNLTSASVARESHASIGKTDACLISGGNTSSGISDKSEIFNGVSWSTLSNLPIKLKKATLIGSPYNALLTGGETSLGMTTNTYKMIGDIWYTTGYINIPRSYHTGKGSTTNAKIIGGVSQGTPYIYNEDYTGTPRLTLSSLTSNGIPIKNFSPNKKSYTIDIYDDIVPTINATSSMGVVSIVPATTIDGITLITVTSGQQTDTISVRFNKLKVTLQGIKVNNVIMDSFRTDINDYIVDILSGDIVNIEPMIDSKFTTTIEGTTTRIIKVFYNGVLSNTYTVTVNNIQLVLSGIIIGSEDVPNFNSNTFNYVYGIAEGETIPKISGVYASDKLNIEVFNTDNIETKSYVKVKFDSREVIYYIQYERVNIGLTGISVYGKPILNFNTSIYEYNISIASVAVIPDVTYNANPILNVVKIDAGNIYNSTIIDVSFRGIFKTYIINWIPVDLTLSEIKYGNSKIIKFRPDMFQYTVDIADGEAMPQLTCIPTSPDISYSITNAILPTSLSIITLDIGGYTRRYEIKWNVISLKISDIFIDSVSLKTFSPDIYNHTASIATGTSKPTLAVRLVNSKASFRYRHIDDMPSELIVSFRGIEKIYYITWTYVNIGLRELYMDGIKMTGISPDILNYTFNVTSLNNLDSIYINMVDINSTHTISTSYNGDVAVTYITISYGYSNKVYKIIWQKYDLLLSSISIDGVKIMNFDPSVKNYIYNISDQESYADITAIPKYDFVTTTIAHGSDYSTVTLSYNGVSNVYRVNWNKIPTELKHITFNNNGNIKVLTITPGIYDYKIKVDPGYQMTVSMVSDSAQFIVNSEYSGGYYGYETITATFRGFSRVYRISILGQGKPHTTEISEFSCDCMLSQYDGTISHTPPSGSNLVLSTPVSSLLGIPNINVSDVTFNYSSLIKGDNMMLGILYVKLIGNDIERFTGISNTSSPLTIRSLVRTTNFTPNSSQYLLNSTFMKPVANMGSLSVDTFRNTDTVLDPSIKVGITSTAILNENKIVNCQFVVQSPDWSGNGTKTISFKKYN